MDTILIYIAELKKLGEKEFELLHPEPVLLIDRSSANLNPEKQFFTREMPVLSELEKQKTTGAYTISRHPNEYLLVKIAKKNHGLWQDRISLGRAKNNDITINNQSISKLHAHFTSNKKGEIFITDIKSSNGIKLNKKRILPNKPTQLNPGDSLRFGEVKASFQQGKSLIKWLQKWL